MDAFPGGDLGHLIETRALFKLSKEDWMQALTLFGKVAIFDLLLANDDRFYRISPPLPFDDAPPFCNRGNIMLHLPLQDTESRTLSEIFCIDNASTSCLRLRSKREYPPAKLKYLQSHSEALLHFYLAPNRQALALKIYSGIMLHIRPVLSEDPDLRKRFCDPFDAREAILKGIAEGYEALEKLDREAFIDTLKKTDLDLIIDDLSMQYMEVIFEHIDQCLQTLQGGK